LKNFVRYGGAFSFSNVDVQYQHAKRTILTIYHDGEEYEKVDLQDIPTEAEMIQLMHNKGFQLKPEEEVASIRQIGAEAKGREEGERNDRMEEMKRRMEAYRANKKKSVEL